MAKARDNVKGLLKDITPGPETALHVRVDAELFKTVKIAAINHDMSIKQVVNQALFAWTILKKQQGG